MDSALAMADDALTMLNRLAALTLAALPLLGETYSFASNDLIVDMSVKHQRRYTGSPLTLYDSNQFSGLVTNLALPAERFRFVVPPGADLIEQ